MGTFLFFIESIAIGLYIFIAILLLWNLRSWVLARRGVGGAHFGLERELAQRQGGRSLTFMMVSVELVLLVWGVANIAAPTWREGMPDEITQQSPTPQTPIQTPSSLGASGPVPTTGAIGSDIIASTLEPSIARGTIIAPGEQIGCDRDKAWIEYPNNGMLVYEPIAVEGTANVENFAFYRFEIKADRSDRNFAAIEGDKIEPVVNGVLGQFLPQSYIEGGFRFRLMVFDTSNIPVASCEITIYISPPIPTEAAN